VQHLSKIAIVTEVHFEWLATGRGPGRPEEGELAAPESVVIDAARNTQESAILVLLRRLPPRKRQVAHAIIEMLTE